MSSLLAIKKQIKSIRGTRKITKAMQLVAASKSKALHDKALSIRKYALELLYVFHHNHENFEEHPFTSSPKDAQDTLFILYSSDKGLCGALNTRLAKELFKSKEWKSTNPENRKVITVGKKAKALAIYNELDIIDSFESIDEKISYIEVMKYTDSVIQKWQEDKFDKIYMIAPHYKSALTFYPLVKQFLPLDGGAILTSHLGADAATFEKSISKQENNFMIYEPSEEVVTDKIIDQLVHTLFMQGFYELKAAEYGSRMIAMQNATDAADKMIEEKSRVYNKARQAAITQEIAEIIGGSISN